MFKDKSVVLAVTGGIAAYKSAELARMFMTEGAAVRVVMTKSAGRFITPLTFQTLTSSPVVDDMWESNTPLEIGHISLADWADVVVIAPATANIIGKIAGGIADDFLSTFLVAVRAPVVICPAMNVNMYSNAIVQENLAKLKSHDYQIVDPGIGLMACGTEGQGRLPELEFIIEETRSALTKQDMAGLKVVVSSGPTREKWDDIRFLSNLSSGKMGTAVAKNARTRGAEVVLVTGPTALPDPYGIETVKIESTLDLKKAVFDCLDWMDVLVMAAAPMDFRPAKQFKGKVKKSTDLPSIQLTLNEDFFVELGQNKGNRILVGFAAEAENLIDYAKGKLKGKNMDLIVANQIGAPGVAFATETNQVTMIAREGNIEESPLLSKDEVAGLIWDRVVPLIKPGKAKARKK
ncbi:MAG: bifunctional phosphopantothenoylcysteine decarboxylase/phosphopantothenate--cysteine ligase CoaBC [Deltaproteobacteria bacterium]|nr:bifunctional phosphopantothenoylcysteine decarboxylase/phosphopantothenate--cysteine ligase CoaBC [Deltaproteobacteria bacterium]